MTKEAMRIIARRCVIALALPLVGCGLTVDPDYLTPDPSQRDADVYESELAKRGPQTVWGDSGGLDIFNLGGGSKKGQGGGGGIGVNSYLWHASLDTISFMPLASADPFGGVIITDWYVPPETPNERYKMSVYILGRQLRADGIRVSVFRQRRTDSQGWTDAKVAPATATNMENQILTRARQLRLATASR